MCAARRRGLQTELTLKLEDILGAGVPSASDRSMALRVVQTSQVDVSSGDADPLPRPPSAATPGKGTHAQFVREPHTSTALLS